MASLGQFVSEKGPEWPVWPVWASLSQDVSRLARLASLGQFVSEFYQKGIYKEGPLGPDVHQGDVGPLGQFWSKRVYSASPDWPLGQFWTKTGL